MKFSHALILASSLEFFACDDSTSADNGSGSADCSVTDGVKVVSPKGGETFEVGETIKVAFCSDVDFGGFGVELRYDEGAKKVNLLAESIDDAKIDGKTVNEYNIKLDAKRGVVATDDAYISVYAYSKQSKFGKSGTFKVKE